MSPQLASRSRNIHTAAAAREVLLQVVETCRQDRYAFFPEFAARLRTGGCLPDVVLMGAQQITLEYHLDMVSMVLRSSPGTRLRAVVDDEPLSPEAAAFIAKTGAEVLQAKTFFARADEFRDCVVVDRYCTWVPGVKYAPYLKKHDLRFMRIEQFVNAPGMPRDLPSPGSHYREHSDFMLENMSAFLEHESVWADDRSRMVYYLSLAAFVSMDFSWFASTCDQYDDRYLPTDIGLQLGEDEIFVDCGAYDGRDSVLFAQKVNNRFQRICAFEPDLRNYAGMSRTLQHYAIEQAVTGLDTFPLGVSDCNGYLGFTGTGMLVALNSAPAATSGGLFVARLDDMLDSCTYLKLEIEGAELAALKGAARLIQRCRPKMAIAAYHKPNDFLDLLPYLQSLDQGYKLTLRHHALEAGLLCIYCL